MNQTLVGLLLTIVLVACQSDPSPEGDTTDPDPHDAPGLITADQGWSAGERAWFYDITQGSQLVHYDWILALEQPDNEELFLADEHIAELGFIPRGFDPNEPDHPGRLPVGLVKDGPRNWLGFTCAACHTSELEYVGSRVRIDGAGALADVESMLLRLTDAVRRTVDDESKLDRFAVRVLGSESGSKARATLAHQLGAYLDVRKDYDRRNVSSVEYGFARLDAFGRIFNKALGEVGAGPDNFNPPDAPVSIPFLWGTDQSDYVQWVGSAENANIGPLARNTGEVLGVFAHVNVAHRHWYTVGYPSSAATLDQIELEQQLRRLDSPVWPEEFPDIDEMRASRGAALYETHCAECHNVVDRADVNRKVVAWMERLDSIGTDPKTARNINDYKGKTGVLNGRKKGILFGDDFGEEALALDIVTNQVLGMLLARGGDDIHAEMIAWLEGHGGGAAKKQGNYDKDYPHLAYKGRSLNGAWATAPFLHNGSVPSLWQLLQKPEKRVETFYVGSLEFDPREVGLEYESATPGAFEFRTRDTGGTPIPGNSNAGHGYGTDLSDDQKWELIEYMKTVMGPR